MTINIQVPSVGESVVEATIGAILRPSGSHVKVDEEILELETEKVNQVIHAPATGQLVWNVKQGDGVKVGQIIGSLTPSSASPEPPMPVAAAPARPPSSLPKSRITLDEALAHRPPPTPSSFPVRREKMTRLRKVIASRLVQVKNETAMLTTFNEVDMSGIIALREKEKEAFEKKYGVRLGFMSFFVKAVVSALQAYPAINASIEGDEILYYTAYDISVAVSTDRGLMVPVIREADKLSYADIEKTLKTFAEKAKNGTLSLEELKGGTFTITNGGVFGSLLSTPILNPPQSGILGMHNIVKRPVAIDDQVVIRPMMYIALSYDHRIVDGKESIGFLMHLKKSLEEPARQLLEL
jgi:2-oxoglutarate dehydrogenase E2 component (dihydrolipoamide succinyltransferase)